MEWVLTAPGYSILDGAIEPNAAFVLGRLKPFEERATPNLGVDAVIGRVAAQTAGIPSARGIPFNLPPIIGLGTRGGFEYQLRSRPDFDDVFGGRLENPAKIRGSDFSRDGRACLMLSRLKPLPQPFPRKLRRFRPEDAINTPGLPKTIIPDDGETIVFGSDGRDSSQDPNSHLAKILIIDPSNGDMEVTAVGVRNVQRLQYVWGGSAIAFADIGGVTAEEINVVNTADLVDTSVVENFGWGRNPDGNAREGTFYIGPGLTMVFGTEPPAIGNAPVPEPGFIQPHAQYSRANPSQFVGATGPAVSPASFDRFQAVFGDLNFGNVCATTDDLTTTDAIVVQPVLVDEDGVPLPNNTLNDLNDPPGRVDPRFFTFPDGTAGVLLEATGKFYRLTEIAD